MYGAEASSVNMGNSAAGTKGIDPLKTPAPGRVTDRITVT